MRFSLIFGVVVGLLVIARGPVVRGADPSTATLAHIRLHGDLDEAPTAEDPIFGTAAENFQTKLDRIRKAERDKNINGLFLHIDGLEIGWGKLHELRHAIAHFRQAGKKAYAYFESGDTKDYLLAIACDEVCIPESGWLLLTGMRAEVSFYKDLLDKIGVKADMLQMGSYKGSGEVLTQNHMSPQFRERLVSVLDDSFRQGPGRAYRPIASQTKMDSRPRQETYRSRSFYRQSRGRGRTDRPCCLSRSI